MMKKKIIIVLCLLLLAIGFLFYRNSNSYDGTYEIYVKNVDNLSPDRYLIVKRNGKETSRYQYIMYNKGEKKAILCYSKNPVVNKYSLDVEELTIVLTKNKEVVAKLIKE